MSLLWLLVIVLVILAVFGGAVLNNLLWLVLIAAAVLAVFALMGGRRTGTTV